MKNKILITLAAFLMALLFFADANHGLSSKRGSRGFLRHCLAQAGHSMKPSGYLLAVLLALFIVAVPNAMRVHWATLGPHWANAAAFFVPGARTEGNHVITRQADVIVNSQRSGAENMQIFSMLFATIFLMNWKRMQAWKSILVYLSTLAALALINLARIITIIIVRARETHYGLTNTLTLIAVILLVWKVKWLRPAGPAPAPVASAPGPPASL